MDVDKDTVQRQRQQLQQHWQDYTSPQNRDPNHSDTISISCSHILHTNIMDSVANMISAQFAQEHPRCPRTCCGTSISLGGVQTDLLGSRTGRPQINHNKCRLNILGRLVLPSFTEPIFSRIAENGHNKKSKLQGSVHFWTIPSATT